jgi:TonB family protein
MKTIKRMLLIYGFLVVLAFPVIAQETSAKHETFAEVDEIPKFKGGQEALIQFIQANIVYPEEAKKNGLQGKVFVSFVIDESGVVSDSKIERSINPALDKEALRVVKQMTEWIPGKKDGKPVKVSLTLPIMFALDASNKKELK